MSNFVVRLDDEVESRLTEAMQEFCIGVKSKAIVMLINKYVPLLRSYQALKADNAALKAKYDELYFAVQNVNKAQQHVKNVLLDPIHQ